MSGILFFIFASCAPLTLLTYGKSIQNCYKMFHSAQRLRGVANGCQTPPPPHTLKTGKRRKIREGKEGEKEKGKEEKKGRKETGKGRKGERKTAILFRFYHCIVVNKNQTVTKMSMWNLVLIISKLVKVKMVTNATAMKTTTRGDLMKDI